MTEENLYDHYKETCSQMKEYNVKRDRLTLYLILCLALFIICLSSPDMLTETVNNYVNADKQIIKVDFSALNSLLIYVTTYIALQYYQKCLTIERTYKYINYLEKELSKGDIKITREGVDYGKDYPVLGNIANIFYAWGIPLASATLAVIRIKTEFAETYSLRWIDTIGLAFILVISLVYLSDRNLYWKYFTKEYKNFTKNQRFLGFLNIDFKGKN